MLFFISWACNICFLLSGQLLYTLNADDFIDGGFFPPKYNDVCVLLLSWWWESRITVKPFPTIHKLKIRRRFNIWVSHPPRNESKASFKSLVEENSSLSFLWQGIYHVIRGLVSAEILVAVNCIIRLKFCTYHQYCVLNTPNTYSTGITRSAF